MTRDDIIRMAREANFYDSEIGGNEDGFVRFAALVAAVEREACANAVWRCHGIGVNDLLKAMDAIRARGETK